MTEISRRSLRFLLFFASVSLQLSSGFSDDSTSSKISSKTKSNGNSSNVWTKVVIILVVLVVVGLFSYFLFKLWQKRKRAKQYARLLKLFEEDGDLEAELGLHD